MKRKLFPVLALTAALVLSAIPVASASPQSPPATNPHPGDSGGGIKPQQVWIDITVSSGTGQANTTFNYQLTSGTQTNRIEISNKGNTSMNFSLRDPRANVWCSGSLDTGKSYITTYDWSPAQSGNWMFKVDTSDGSPVSGWLKVKTDVPQKREL
jgi:hypothetical protein